MAVENGTRPLPAAVRPENAGGDARVHTRMARAFERRSVFPYLLIAPLIGGLIFLTYIPILEGLRLSLTDATLGANSSKYIGLSNFTTLLKEPLFWQTFFQTVVWTVASVGLALVFGVAAGLSLRGIKKRAGVMRAVLLLPWAAPPVVIAYMWRFLLSPTGPLSPYLVTLGLAKEPPDMLKLSFDLPWLVTSFAGGDRSRCLVRDTVRVHLCRRRFVHDPSGGTGGEQA